MTSPSDSGHPPAADDGAEGGYDNPRTSTSPEQHRRLKELVEASLELPEPERKAYLERECGSDPRMLRQAEELLDLYRDDDVDVAPAELEQIGPYRLITELGAGGMGVVYLAQREDGFSRTVAVKVIRRGMDTDYFLDRFQQEREILGSLDHPGIVRIVDAGSTADGRPYLVMDFVDGVRIDAFCETLTVREKVALFIKVCAAVQHAHRNLIVHRDLKPGNILVTVDGQPKLLDFGIAKVLDQEESDATSATVPIMTRQYASPEQVRGQRANTSSDVYALGLILYELLAGARPYELKDLPVGDAERMICDAAPPEPSRIAATKQIAHELRGDLDRILLMALRKEPERRYASVEALSADLERFLQGRPVSAQKDTFTYRASKFVQRNRASVVVAGVMLLLIATGGSSTLWQARIAGHERARAEREAALAKASEAQARRMELLAQQAARDAETARDRAEEKAREADRQRQRAEERFRDVRSMANSLLFDFHAMIRNLPGSTEAREFLIRKSIENLERLNAEAASNPGLQKEVAAGYEQLGQLQGASDDAALGDTRGAFNSQSRALEIRQKLVAANPGNPDLLRDLAASYLRMAELMQALNMPMGSLESARKAQGTYAALVAGNPADTLSLLGLAASQQACGQAYAAAGKLQQAIQAYAEHTATRRRIEAASPGDLELQSQTAEARDLEAHAMEIEGRFGDALRVVRETGAVYRKAAEAQPHSLRAVRNVIENHRAIATLSERTGDLSGARQNYEEALRRMQGLSSSDQKNAALLVDLALLRNSYASTLFRMGRSDEAASQYQTAIQAAAALREKDPGNPSIQAALAAAYRGLGQTHQERKRLQEAQSSFRSAIEIFDGLAQTASRNINTQMNLALACIDLGRVLRDLDNLRPAEQQFRRAISILEKILPGSRDHRVLSNLGIAYNRLADVYRLQGNAKLALVTYSRVEPIAELLLQKDPRNSAAYSIRAESASRTGMIHESSQDWPAALTAFQKAVAIDSEISARDPGDLRARSNLAASHYRVCEVRFRLLQYDAAFDACRRAVAAWREAKSAENLRIALARASEIRFAQAEEDGKESLQREGCSLLQEAVRMGAAMTPEIRKRLERCGVPQ